MKSHNKARRGRLPGEAETGPNRSSISHTKNNLSSLIDRVRHGETITIVDRDKPVARLVPVAGPTNSEMAESLAALERAGLIRLGSARPGAVASGWQPVKPREGTDILAAMLAERREDWR